MFSKKKITIPLVKRYCQGTEEASSIFRTTKGPNDQTKPAIITNGIANFEFFISNILEYLMLNFVYYNKNYFLLFKLNGQNIQLIHLF